MVAVPSVVTLFAPCLYQPLWSKTISSSQTEARANRALGVAGGRVVVGDDVAADDHVREHGSGGLRRLQDVAGKPVEPAVLDQQPADDAVVVAAQGIEARIVVGGEVGVGDAGELRGMRVAPGGGELDADDGRVAGLPQVHTVVLHDRAGGGVAVVAQ
jgi:hypothetical protein